MPELDRPVLVTGTPRSGKTVITRILRQDPAFCYVIEPLTIWNTGMGGRPDDVRTAAEATPNVIEDINARCAEIVRNEGKHRYLDDLAYHALRIGFAHRVIPHARIIHVIRNSADAIPEMLFGWTFKDSVTGAFQRRRKNLRLRSLPRLALRFAQNYLLSRVRGRRASWGPRVPGLTTFAQTRSIAEVAAYQWCKMVEIGMAGMAELPPGTGLQICFDDILADPAAIARQIAEFCEYNDPDHAAEFARTYINPNHRFDRKVYPEAEEMNRIRQLVSPIQAKVDALRRISPR